MEGHAITLHSEAHRLLVVCSCGKSWWLDTVEDFDNIAWLVTEHRGITTEQP